MSTESIEQLIEAEVERRLKERGPAITPEDKGTIYVLGAKLFIRTVTHYQIGEVCYVGPDEIGMINASWVANTGRFHDFLKTGEMSELEPAISRLSIGRGAIVDAYIWTHDLPKVQK